MEIVRLRRFFIFLLYFVFACIKDIAFTLGLIQIFEIVTIICVLNRGNVVKKVVVFVKVLVWRLFLLFNSCCSLRFFWLLNRIRVFFRLCLSWFCCLTLCIRLRSIIPIIIKTVDLSFLLLWFHYLLRLWCRFFGRNFAIFLFIKFFHQIINLK